MNKFFEENFIKNSNHYVLNELANLNKISLILLN